MFVSSVNDAGCYNAESLLLSQETLVNTLVLILPIPPWPPLSDEQGHWRMTSGQLLWSIVTLSYDKASRSNPDRVLVNVRSSFGGRTRGADIGGTDSRALI